MAQGLLFLELVEDPGILTPSSSQEPPSSPVEMDEAILAAILEDRDAIEIPEDLVRDPSPGPAEAVPTSGLRLSDLTVAQQMKLALRGNRRTRTALFDGGSCAVQRLVVQNPGITEEEILGIVKSPKSDPEVLRAIAENHEWTAIYSLRVALVENPRLPIIHALRIVTSLSVRDLTSLARSRSVPTAVATRARQILAQKGQAPKEIFTLRRLRTNGRSRSTAI